MQPTLLRPAFEPPPDRLAVPGGVVHVWRVDLEAGPGRLDRLARHLPDDERALADRYATAALRRRFLARRGALRDVLSRYLGVAPPDVAIVREDSGRPRLAEGDATLRFSAADSGDLALIAVAREDVGVDVERLRRVERADEIARRWFGEGDRRRFERLAAQGDGDAAFLSAWTRLEARVKRVGGGLLLPGREAIGDADEPLSFEPAAGYVAALAGARSSTAVRWWSGP
jgi:4'-phosphopantetheinyl transferase